MASRISQEVLEAVRQPSPDVRVTQEVLEVVLLRSTAGDTAASAQVSGTAVIPAAPGVRVSQEVAEAVLSRTPDVRSTQEVLEVVLLPGAAGDTEASAEQSGTAAAGAAPVADSWTVSASPQVFWTGEVPVNAFAVICTPRVEWDDTVTDTTIRWTVTCEPEVTYVTGPGTASTECISAPGTIPPRSEEPAESLEQNYVF